MEINMCKIKSGEKIQNEQDLKNLITGLILRQENEFQEKRIYDLLEMHSKGSPLNISKDRKMQLIGNALDIFCRYGDVICHGGIYRTRDLF